MKVKNKNIIHKSLKKITCSNNTIIIIYRSAKSKSQEIDIKLFFKNESTKDIEKPFKLIYWIIDFLIKKEHNKELTMEFISYLNSILLS